MDKIKQLMIVATAIVFVAILFANISLVVSTNRIDFPQKPLLSDSKVPSEQEAKTKEITNYQTLSTELVKRKTDIFDLIVIKTLLPLFTTLITGVFTYIIAKFGIQSYRKYLLDKQKN